MVTTCTLASSSSPTRRHSGKNHSSLGSLISTRSWPENCSSNHSRTSMLTCSSRQSLAVSAQAVGLASEACTLAWRRYCVCLSTTHCGSPKPRGLISSAFTHGLGTWKPRLPTTLENRLVPLRPEPATSNRCLPTRCSLPVVRRLRGRSNIPQGVEELPLSPLTSVDLHLEVRVRPVPELVGVQPLQLEAHPVRCLEVVVGVGPYVFPIEAFDERVLGGVAPT